VFLDQRLGKGKLEGKGIILPWGGYIYTVSQRENKSNYNGPGEILWLWYDCLGIAEKEEVEKEEKKVVKRHNSRKRR